MEDLNKDLEKLVSDLSARDRFPNVFLTCVIAFLLQLVFMVALF